MQSTHTVTAAFAGIGRSSDFAAARAGLATGSVPVAVVSLVTT